MATSVGTLTNSNCSLAHNNDNTVILNYLKRIFKLFSCDQL